MTYRELAYRISLLTDEQKDCDISVYLNQEDEYRSGCDAELYITVEKDCDVLDEKHPFLVL